MIYNSRLTVNFLKTLNVMQKLNKLIINISLYKTALKKLIQISKVFTVNQLTNL